VSKQQDLLDELHKKFLDIVTKATTEALQVMIRIIEAELVKRAKAGSAKGTR